MIHKLADNFHWLAFGIYSIAFGILDATDLIAVDDDNHMIVFHFITDTWFAWLVCFVGVMTIIDFWPYKKVEHVNWLKRSQSLVVSALLFSWTCITIGSIFNHGSSFLAVAGSVLIIHILLRAYTD